jgi:DNA-binding NarL/FixJ family response regulator
MKTRILLVDDHKMIRDGLRALLTREPDMEVVGEAADGREAIRAAGALGPDVVIMDISMPVMNGIEAMHHLLKANRALKVIVLSVYSSEPLVRSVLAAGACGYVQKGADFSDLATAVRDACRVHPVG